MFRKRKLGLLQNYFLTYLQYAIHTWTIQATRMNPMSKRMSCCGAHVHEHIDLLSSLHYTSKSDTINIALEYNKGCGFMCDPSCKDQSKKYNKQLDKCFSCNMSNMFAQSNSPSKYVIISKTKT